MVRVGGGSLQGNCAVCVVLWEQELGCERVHAKICIGIPLSGIRKNCRDDSAAYYERILVVAPGVWRARDSRALDNQGIYPTESGHHWIAGGLPDPMTWSSPRCHLCSHYSVCIKNHLFIVGIGPILNEELKFIDMIALVVREYEYYAITFIYKNVIKIASFFAYKNVTQSFKLLVSKT